MISKLREKKRTYIARKILVAFYHILSTGVFYSTDASKVENTDKDKIKFTKNNFMQSKKTTL